MFNSVLTASNVNAVADKIEFATALIATVDPIVKAKGVASYKRIAERADKITTQLSPNDQYELQNLARSEVAARRFMRRETAAVMRARREELGAMRAALEA